MISDALPTTQKGIPLSPRGRGLRRLSERSDPRVGRARGRSWVRGLRPAGRAARERCGTESGLSQLALLRARAAIAALPLIQLRLSSLALAKAPHPSPARGEGWSFLGER